MPSNVIYAGDCIRYIRSKDIEVLSQEQVREVTETIQNGRLKPGIKTNREHTAHVKKIIELKEDGKVCPKCGSGMVVRESKKGPMQATNFGVAQHFQDAELLQNSPNKSINYAPSGSDAAKLSRLLRRYMCLSFTP